MPEANGILPLVGDGERPQADVGFTSLHHANQSVKIAFVLLLVVAMMRHTLNG
jgi:hypothetical protein